MYLYGGVYADLDVICLRPFEALVEAERRARPDAEGGHDAEPAAVLGMIRHGR
jgi:mannosyltransferase OCH1-like enzyme